MKIDGSAPIKGTPGDRPAASKANPKGDGKSFAAAFNKAATAHPLGSSPSPAPAAPAPVAATTPAAATLAPAQAAASHEEAALNPAPKEGPVKHASISSEDHMEAIKFRLKTGYYNTKNVDDALTDKLTGFFDELA